MESCLITEGLMEREWRRVHPSASAVGCDGHRRWHGLTLIREEHVGGRRGEAALALGAMGR
jgi:hypothetical protein